MDFDLIVRNGTVVFPDRSPQRLDVAIQGGKFAALLAPGTPVFVVRGRRLVGFDAAALGAALDAQ